MKVEKLKVIGRPSIYTEALGKEICEAVACDGKSLITLCKENSHWPDRRNIYRWMMKHESFRLDYAQAKRFQIEALVDDILNISDDVSQDYVVDNDGITFNATHVQRARLMVDTRKWFAAKLCPRLYGDKIQHEGTVAIKHADALKELE